MKKIYKILFMFFVMITLIGLQVVKAQEEAPIINEEQPSELAKGFNELDIEVNFTATYDTTTWNSFATTTTTLIKKLIYKLEPYSWKKINNPITYTLTAATYDEMLSKYPASKLYAYPYYQVCRVGESSYTYYICSPD